MKKKRYLYENGGNVIMVLKAIKIDEDVYKELWRIKSETVLSTGKNLSFSLIIKNSLSKNTKKGLE